MHTTHMYVKLPPHPDSLQGTLKSTTATPAHFQSLLTSEQSLAEDLSGKASVPSYLVTETEMIPAKRWQLIRDPSEAPSLVSSRVQFLL